MSVVLVTGSSGLVGAETVRKFCSLGFEVVGIDNNLRSYFFGADGDTVKVQTSMISSLHKFIHFDFDIRDKSQLAKVFSHFGKSIELVVHSAAQPSHDWAARDPEMDFSVNANGTLNLLECLRKYSPESVFIYMSTNKVYGDLPNHMNYSESKFRYNLKEESFSENGFDESLSIDQSMHSLFGVSKLSGDLLTQEYGRYFGLKTVCLRGGCLSGPGHQGAELHGFLSYLVKCAVRNSPYTIFGYKGKQVRDNLHSRDVASAFWEIYQKPQFGEVFNIGGGKYSNISILEAVNYLTIRGFDLQFKVEEQERKGDHKWWISNLTKFEQTYPKWKVTRNSFEIIDETIDALINS